MGPPPTLLSHLSALSSLGSLPRCSPPAPHPRVQVTNSIPLPPGKKFPQLTVLSVARLLGDTVSRVFTDTSVNAGVALTARD